MNLALNTLATPADSLHTKRRLINSLLQGGPDGGDVVAAARNRLAQTQSNVQAQQQLKAQQQLLKQMRQQQMRDARMTANIQPMPYRPGTAGRVSTMPMPTGHLGDWIRQAIMMTKHTGMGLAPGIRNMIMHESGGRPDAINNWDSNAARGTPSIGLMQTIQPTFDAYAKKGHTNIYNPVDNIIAGLRYALKNYGHGMVRAGGRHDSRGNYIGY